jgi:hypothetical protein
MSNALEYLFAANIFLADRAARSLGWRAHGTGWIKLDGEEVQFICLIEQLAFVGKGETTTTWVSSHLSFYASTANGRSFVFELSERDKKPPALPIDNQHPQESPFLVHLSIGGILRH